MITFWGLVFNNINSFIQHGDTKDAVLFSLVAYAVFMCTPHQKPNTEEPVKGNSKKAKTKTKR
jgi:hypothetical protein